MKTTMIILIMLISLSANSQSSGTQLTAPQSKQAISNNDAINHTVFGLSVSACTNLLIYEGLYRWTDIPTKKVKWISFASGILINTSLAYIREQNDLKQGFDYNTEHITYSLIGGVLGGGVTILIGNDYRNIRKRKQQIKTDISINGTY